MFSVDLGMERSLWNENYGEENGSFAENLRNGKAWRSRQLCELMREQSIDGGMSTGNQGGRVYTPNSAPAWSIIGF
jgi:hypothetical protein